MVMYMVDSDGDYFYLMRKNAGELNGSEFGFERLLEGGDLKIANIYQENVGVVDFM